MTERIFQIRPAFDKRDPDPKKDYGVHGCEMVFVIKGEKGAVQFLLYTNWHLPHVTEESDKRILAKAKLSGLEAMGVVEPEPEHSSLPEGVPDNIKEIFASATRSMFGRAAGLDKLDLKITYHPLPADLGFHSPVPMYEDHDPIGAKKMDHEAWERNRVKLKEGGEAEGFEFEETLKDTGTFTPCEYLDGRPCHYDGSSLNAQKVYDILLVKGSDGVWDYLEKYYISTFGELT